MALRLFYGYNGGPAGAVTGDPVIAREAFLAALQGTVSNQNFESFAAGTSPAIFMTFTGSAGNIDAAIYGDGAVAAGGDNGRFNTTPGGSKLYQVSGDFDIEFNGTPIRAFGFYGTDVGDFNGRITVELTNTADATQTLTIMTPISAPNATLIFWGFIDPDNAYKKITFGNTGAGVDFFGFDDMVVADGGQIVIEEGFAIESETAAGPGGSVDMTRPSGATATAANPAGAALLRKALWLPRYQSGMVISTAGDPRESMAELIEAMAGRQGWAGGVWRMRAGHMPAPVFEMGPDWLAKRLQSDGTPEPGPTMSITNGVAREQKVNRVTGSCVDPNQRHLVMPFPAVEDPVLIAADGAVYALDVQLQAVPDPFHAQYIGQVLIKQAQAPMRMTAQCNLRAYPVELFDVGTLSLPAYGISGKTMEVRGWRWTPSEGPQLTLAEITQQIFEPEAELTGRDPAPNTNLPAPWLVEDLTGLAVTSGTVPLSDGSVLTRTRVAWSAAVAQQIRVGGRVEVQFAEITDSATPSWQVWEEDGGQTAAIIPALKTSSFYVFRARFVTAAPLRVRGKWSAQVLAQIATQAPAAGSVLQVVVDQHDFAGTAYAGLALTARTLTVTPSADCILDFQARIVASQVVPDSGNRITWLATPDGGSAVTLGAAANNYTSTPGECTATAAITAAGGVPVTFAIRVDSPTANPDLRLYQSSIRITVIKAA